MNPPQQAAGLSALLADAQSRDAADPLASFRQGFRFPQHTDGTDKLYFTGNSLGLQHQSVDTAVAEVMDSWRTRAVEGHFRGERPWMTYHELLRDGQADLLGAKPSEVVAVNTLSVNLHLAMVSFYRPSGKRTRILMERNAFPSDRYAVESQIRWHGLDPQECLVEIAPADGQRLIEESQVEAYLAEHGGSVALVLWPGVQYATGQVFDLPRIAAAGRGAGACVGFDLAHSAGNIPLALHDSGCDFAAWCTYKYLNAGPGAVAGLFIHERHDRNPDLPRLHGWYGNNPASRFRMAPEFDPAPGADAWVISNPPILAMAPLLASLQVFATAGMQNLRQKSIAMTGWLAQAIESNLSGQIEIITPSETDRRGCQLSLRVRGGRDTGRELFQYLEQSGVVPDWREPDVIRVAPVPLYNRFEDGARLVQLIHGWFAAQA